MKQQKNTKSHIFCHSMGVAHRRDSRAKKQVVCLFESAQNKPCKAFEYSFFCSMLFFGSHMEGTSWELLAYFVKAPSIFKTKGTINVTRQASRHCLCRSAGQISFVTFLLVHSLYDSSEQCGMGSSLLLACLPPKPQAYRYMPRYSTVPNKQPIKLRYNYD